MKQIANICMKYSFLSGLEFIENTEFRFYEFGLVNLALVYCKLMKNVQNSIISKWQTLNIFDLILQKYIHGIL